LRRILIWRSDNQNQALNHTKHSSAQTCSVAQSHAGPVFVIENEEIDVGRRGTALHTFCYGPAEAELGAPHSIDDAIRPFVA
jgi:hypothetical protein